MEEVSKLDEAGDDVTSGYSYESPVVPGNVERKTIQQLHNDIHAIRDAFFKAYQTHPLGEPYSSLYADLDDHLNEYMFLVSKELGLKSH